LANRAKALAIQEDVFFKRFNVVRKWQKSCLDFIQDNNYIKTASGQFIRLLGMPQDCAKSGLSSDGQGGGAAHVQAIMCVMDDHRGEDFTMKLQVHDELVFEQSKDLTNDACIEYIRRMEGETEILPGFTCPIEVKRGPNWKEMEVIWEGD
jgi:DNA polymerase I-like protein with 3'-5' exonuclease and polymerase domains